jgi:hypothetical protein
MSHTRITPRTLLLALLITLSATAVVILIVLLVRPPSSNDPSTPAADTNPTDLDDLQVRALIPPQPPLPARAQDIVLTANLFHAEPGEPLPRPYPDSKTTNDTPRGLTPTGQAALHCTAVADKAIRTICTGTALTPRGQITFAGAMIENDALAEPPDADLSFTITGGTGDYQSASGLLSITSYTPTQQDWLFHFTPTPTPSD